MFLEKSHGKLISWLFLCRRTDGLPPANWSLFQTSVSQSYPVMVQDRSNRELLYSFRPLEDPE